MAQHTAWLIVTSLPQVQCGYVETHSTWPQSWRGLSRDLEKIKGPNMGLSCDTTPILASTVGFTILIRQK